MNDDSTRAIIAILVVVGFYGIIGVVLFGFVDVSDPTLAKLTGGIFGYITAIMTPVITRYFKDSGG